MSVKPQPGMRSSSPSLEKATKPEPRPADPARLRELTSKIAYELYEKRGRSPGHDLEDWFEAEKIAKARPIA